MQSPGFSSMQSSRVRRRHVAPLGNAETAVAGRGRRARAERAPRVEMMSSGNMVTSSRPGFAGSSMIRNLYFPAISAGHANEANAAHVHHPRLNTCRPGELPATHHAVQDRVHVRPEPLAAADREGPVPLRLDRMTHVVVGIQHTAVMEAEERRAVLARVLVIGVDARTLREPPADLELQRVVVAGRAAVADIDVIHVRIHDKEIGWVGRRRPRCSTREIAVEVGGRIARLRLIRPMSASARCWSTSCPV